VVKWRALPAPREAAANSPPADFAQTVLPHLNAAYNLARWLVRDGALAEDVVQDASLRALGYFASFRGGDGRAWLLRIVRNVAHTALAERRRLPIAPSLGSDDAESPALLVPEPGDDPEAAMGRRQDIASLHAALAALPAELRECLVLRELEELSYRDIAQVTGVPVGTVMSRLFRARQALIAGQAEGKTP
jgi:RNA polymerase sigma-70 factor (ECF subfamily)